MATAGADGMEQLSDASCCSEHEGWEEWESQSSVSQSQSHQSTQNLCVDGTCPEAARLRRALKAERARATSAARAHDARLAELHGVIAELVRRRDTRPVLPEESEHSETEGCDSTTQPAGELPAEECRECRDAADAAVPGDDVEERSDYIGRSDSLPPTSTSLDTDKLDALDSGQGVDIESRRHHNTGAAYEESELVRAHDARRAHARTATRVLLKRAAEPPRQSDAGDDCAALVALAARCETLAADNRLLEHALQDAKEQAERLSETCAAHESWSVCLCAALRAADRALETYDVLLALAETLHQPEQRGAAEGVASAVLARLERAGAACLGEPLLPPGPWLQPNTNTTPASGESTPVWSEDKEALLRAHAARLKRETAAVRAARPAATLHTHSCYPERGGSVDAEERNGQSRCELVRVHGSTRRRPSTPAAPVTPAETNL